MMTTFKDLRNWVEDHAGDGFTPAEIDGIAEAIRDMDRPGWDELGWKAFLDGLNLNEIHASLQRETTMMPMSE
jgi:hypothetical protein